MELRVIGSSSAGNAYLLRAEDGQSLLIEAGCPFKAIKRACDYNVSDIVGCIVTHEHGDHAGHVGEILKSTNIKVYASNGTVEAIKAKGGISGGTTRLRVLEGGKMAYLGAFRVIPIPLEYTDKNGEVNWLHDAEEPFCYLVRHEEMGTLLFATDCYCLPGHFTDINQLMIECNYDKGLLDEHYKAGLIDPKRRNRTIQSHMSSTTCVTEVFKTSLLSNLKNIVLIHVSNDNGIPRLFERMVKQASGCESVWVANAGMQIPMNKIPF